MAGDTKEGGEMSMEEIWPKWRKNRRKTATGDKLTKSLKKMSTIAILSVKFRFVSLGNFPIFPTSPARAQDTKSIQFYFIFLKKT